jgi:hypothetical protein
MFGRKCIAKRKSAGSQIYPEMATNVNTIGSTINPGGRNARAG